MAKLSIVAGATSQSINIFIQDSTSTTGAGKTGLLFNTAGLIAYYTFTGANAGSVQIVLATLATVGAAYSSGGFKEIDSTNMPGWYRLDLPNAALATGKGRVVDLHLQGATGMAPCPVEIELTGWDNQNATTGGMSALPNAAAGASGGLIINGSNSGTVTLAALTCTGSFTISDGLLVSRSTSNTSAFTCTGNGTGSGAVFHSGGGATGDGFQVAAASTTGNGFTATGAGSGAGYKSTGGASGPGCLFGSGNTSGNGVTIISNGSTGDGLNISCNAGHGINTSGGTGAGNNGINAAATGGSGGNGLNAAGDTGGAGIKATGGSGGNGILSVGGATSGDSILCTTTSGHAITLTPSGTAKHGINAVGSAAVSTAAAGNGANFAGGAAATGAGGTAGVGWNVVGGAGAASTNGAANGGVFTGGGTTTVSGGSGLVVTGTGAFHGLAATSGAGASGDGIHAISASTNGSGLSAAGTGSGAGISASNSNGTGSGVLATGRGAGHGISALGGGSISGAAAGNGFNAQGGQANAGSAGAAGAGFNAVGGVASTTAGAVAGAGFMSTGGAGAASTNGAGAGMTTAGGGTTTVSGASGLVATGTGTLAAVTAALIQGDLGGRVLGNTATAFSGVGVDANVTQILGTASAGAPGYVGIDWANIDNPTATVALTNTTISAGSNPTAAQIATAVWTDTTGSDFAVNGSPGKIVVTQLGGTFTTNSSSVFTTAALANAPTGGSAPTVGQIATAVWQDTTAGDFTVAGSIGKSLFTSGNAPGAASGLALVGSNMGTVTSVTGAVGSVTGNVGGNVVGSVGSVTGNVGGNVVGSTGSVTGAVGSVTGNVGGNVTGTVGSVVGAVGSVTGNVGGNVVGSVGSIAGVTFPSNFGALGITAGGKITEVQLVDTLTTYTNNTPQTGDSYAIVNSGTFGNAALHTQIGTPFQTTSILSQAAMNAVADSTLRRTAVNVEGSAYGDAVGMKSLYSAIQQLQASSTVPTPGVLTVYKTDHATVLGTITLTSNPTAPPTTGASVN